MTPASGTPVLTYHSLDTTGSVISTAPAVFIAQMRSLAARGFTGISADHLIAAWNGAATLPANAVVLTFDDGFANFRDVAIPVLRELNFRATVYVIADFAGQTNDWAGQPAHIPRLPLMTWEAIGEVAAAGFEIGGHTATHPDLRAASASMLEREIGDSRRTIEREAGATVTTFAYPYGGVSSAAIAVVRAHYAAAFGTAMGSARAADNHHDIRRIDTYYYRSPLAFSLFGSFLGASYIAVRAFGRACHDALLARPRTRND